MALKFNGSTQYVSVADSAKWDYGTGDFSIMVKFRLFIITGNQALFDSQGGGSGIGVRLMSTSATNFQVNINGAADVNFTTSTRSAFIWYTATLVRSGGRLRAYLDSAQQGTDTGDAQDITGATGLFTLATQSNAAGNFMNGELEYAHVYKGKGLTIREIQQLVSRPGSIREGLVLFMPMFGDESPVPDLSGDPTNGTLNNTPTKASGSPTGRPYAQRQARLASTSVPGAGATTININIVQSVNVTGIVSKDFMKQITQSIGTTGVIFKDFMKQITQSVDVTATRVMTFEKNIDPLGINVTGIADLVLLQGSGLLGFIGFLGSANAAFLNMQSGNARPYFYIEAIISGVTSVIGKSYSDENWLIDGGLIDRELPAIPGDRSNIFNSDVTLKVDNSTRRFSPLSTSSVFYQNDYLESVFNYWAGFQRPSGTALLIQRGTFLLDDLRIDGRQNIAYMRLKDKFKRAFDRKIGTRDPSGTATQFQVTGTVGGDQVIRSLLITGAGLTAGDMDLQTGVGNFNNISFSEQTIANALSLVAEASDGFVFTDRRGSIRFISNAPVFATSTSAFSIRESHIAQSIFFEETKNDRLNKVTVEFQSGTDVAFVSETPGNTANALLISNDAIQATAEAQSISSRVLDRFSGQVSRIEINGTWTPSLDLNDRIQVYSDNLYITGQFFQVYKIQEEPTQNSMRIWAISERGLKSLEDNKFAFFSDPSATNCGTVFTGGTGELDGWRQHYGFFARETTTAVNPGFDQDGNNNNVINTSYAASGAGSTGIEVPFLFY